MPPETARAYGGRVSGVVSTSGLLAQPPGRTSLRIVLPYRVPYADTDQMGVVYYANYLVYFERARNEALRACGCTYKEIEASGILLPVLEAQCDYHQPAVYDDLLEIAGWFELASLVRIKALCEVRRNGTGLACGRTVHVVLSARSRKPTRLPAQMLARIFDRA